jgi:hypothetical protein
MPHVRRAQSPRQALPFASLRLLLSCLTPILQMKSLLALPATGLVRCERSDSNFLMQAEGTRDLLLTGAWRRLQSPGLSLGSAA